jgi:hypothetical protein
MRKAIGLEAVEAAGAEVTHDAIGVVNAYFVVVREVPLSRSRCNLF